MKTKLRSSKSHCLNSTESNKPHNIGNFLDETVLSVSVPKDNLIEDDRCSSLLVPLDKLNVPSSTPVKKKVAYKDLEDTSVVGDQVELNSTSSTTNTKKPLQEHRQSGSEVLQVTNELEDSKRSLIKVGVEQFCTSFNLMKGGHISKECSKFPDVTEVCNKSIASCSVLEIAANQKENNVVELAENKELGTHNRYKALNGQENLTSSRQVLTERPNQVLEIEEVYNEIKGSCTNFENIACPKENQVVEKNESNDNKLGAYERWKAILKKQNKATNQQTLIKKHNEISKVVEFSDDRNVNCANFENSAYQKGNRVENIFIDNRKDEDLGAYERWQLRINPQKHKTLSNSKIIPPLEPSYQTAKELYLTKKLEESERKVAALQSLNNEKEKYSVS